MTRKPPLIHRTTVDRLAAIGHKAIGGSAGWDVVGPGNVMRLQKATAAEVDEWIADVMAALARQPPRWTSKERGRWKS